MALLAPLSVVGDLLLTPSAPGAAPEGLAYTGDPVMCRPWTLLGLPAANVPAYRRQDGLPVGVQLVSLARHDLRFLADLASAETGIAHKEE
jgi:Asp-tRNA(Asn)/Glu-tRNA(Gln) amidotransferase A subunit family amidase